MDLDELGRVLDALEAAGLRHWLEGGWGIDALVGNVTREHGDADVDIDARDEVRALAVLGSLGYELAVDQRPTRVELRSEQGHVVDLHPLHFQPDGDAHQLSADGSAWVFRADWFTWGSLAGRRVPCFTASAQRSFHTGYDLRDVDRLDLSVLDRLDD